MEVSVINKKKFIEMDSKNSNSEEKYELCVGIAKYYIQIAHLYAAIATTVNPTYTYSNITGKPDDQSSCKESANNFKIPNEIKVGGTPSSFIISPGEMAAPMSPTSMSPTPMSPTPMSPTPMSPTPMSPTPMSPTPMSPTPMSPTPLASNYSLPTPEQLPELKISDKLHQDYQTDLRGKSKLPSDVYITKTNIKGLCNSRLASLANGINLEDLDIEATISLKPTFCDMNKSTKIDIEGIPENKTLLDEPGIPELEGLYKDKYDYNKGEYVGLSSEMQTQYEKDLKIFYTAFTGNEVMPKNITKFCQIGLREFHNTIGCSSKEAQFSNYQELMGSRVYKAFDESIMISENGGTGMAKTLTNVEGFTEDFIVGDVKNHSGQLYPQQEIEIYEKDPLIASGNNPKVKFINNYAGAYRKEYTGTLKERLFKKYADHLIKMMQNAETQKKALLENLRKVFIKNPNPSSGKLFIISNKLTSESLADITDNVRDIIVKMYIDCETDFIEGIKLFDALIDKQILDEAISTKRQLSKSIKDDEDNDAIIEFKYMDTDISINKEMTQEDIEYYTMLFNRYISENDEGVLNLGLSLVEFNKFMKELPINMTKNQKDALFDKLNSNDYVDIESLLEWLNSDDYRSLLMISKKINDSGSVYIETPHSVKTSDTIPALMSDELKVSDKFLALFPNVREKYKNIKFLLYSSNTIPGVKGSATLKCCNMDMNITPSPLIIGYSTGYKNPPLFLEHVPGLNDNDEELFKRNKDTLTNNILGINYWFLIKQETKYVTNIEDNPSTSAPKLSSIQEIPSFNNDQGVITSYHNKDNIKGLDLAELNSHKKMTLAGGAGEEDFDSHGIFDLDNLSSSAASPDIASPDIASPDIASPDIASPATTNEKRVVLLWWFRNILETNNLNNIEINPNINNATTTIESIKNTNSFIRKLNPNFNYFEL